MTDSSELPPDVARSADLLADSLEALHVLLLLHRHPDRPWTTAEVAADLGIAVASANRELAALQRKGLARTDDHDDHQFRFDPSDEALMAHVQRVVAAHGTRRIALINHVATGALHRIRALADAFRVKKEDKQ